MIYLDSNATTQVHPEVYDEMLPFLTDQWYNPSSGYRAAKYVKVALEKAHEQVAALINAKPEEIVMTGCGTESNNAVLFSVINQSSGNRKIVTSEIEHSAILRFCEALQTGSNCDIKKVGVDAQGRLLLEKFEKGLSQGDVTLASVMWANNETGIIQPIEEAAALARKYDVAFHTDAIQAVGKVPVDVKLAGVDYLSISGHKFHAPKGVGALYVREGMRFDPLLRGGGQENGRRSGTENVASIVGMGKAAELMKQSLEKDGHAEVEELRNYFETRILEEVEGVTINGSQKHRIVNTSHLSFDGCEAAGLLILLDEYGVLCSAGSACMTGKQQPSHVQTAMGISALQAKSSLRISFSIFSKKQETDDAVEALKKAVKKLRSVQGGPGVGPVQIYTEG